MPAVRHGVPATAISPTARSAGSSGRRLAPSDERPARDSDYSESATQVSENAVDPQRPDLAPEGPILDHAGSGSSLENTELRYIIYVILLQPSAFRVWELTWGRRTLSERHVNMMTFSAVIGIGFFLQSGRVIYLTGPGLAFIAYLLMGSVMWSVNACLGEMTALFPVTGALFELPCRFVDESIGYTVGWMSWWVQIFVPYALLIVRRFSWVVIIASELDAVASLFNFRFKHDYLVHNHFPNPTLEWSTNNTNPAVWVTIFLFGVVIPVNCLKVRWFGEIEYVIGVLKMLFFVGLIMFNIILNALTGTGFKYYRSPWGFTSATFKTDDGHIYTGSSAHLYGMWSAMTITIFSMIGFEMIAVSARENKDYATREGVKLATRKISLRIILLYTLGVFVVGLNVPYDDTNLVDNAIAALNNGQYSAFTIAAVRGGVTGWPNFMNAFFILSATSSGINSLYISSRILHALAATKRVWPEWEWAERARLRLEHTHKGVPINAVFVSSAFGLLAYLAAGKSPSVVSCSRIRLTEIHTDNLQALGRMALNSTVSMLIVYVVICITFLNFKKRYT